MPLSAGERLGPYEILAPIGAGGMGEVYRAQDTRLKREVALKILPEASAYDPVRRQRFDREARAVAALNQPNIVAIHDIGSENGILYIVTELVDGEPLNAAKLNLRRTLDCAVQIATGLAAAHAALITHRDLKPANILLTRDGRIKILDFGLAKMPAPQASFQSDFQSELERHGNADPKNRSRGGHGNGGLHGTGTGEGAGGRPSLRHLQLRRHSV